MAAMNRERRVEQLRERTLGARDQVARPLDESGSRSDRWSPGDLLVLATTAGFDVEWAVLEADSRAQRLRIVAADLDPRVGSTDVAVQGSDSGRLTLRCSSELWIRASALHGATKTGRLSSADVERGRQKCAEIAARSITGSVFEREIDDEPGYRARLAEVQQARQALLESLASKISSDGPAFQPRSADLEERATDTAPGRRWPKQARFPWTMLVNPYPAAAAVLLISTLGLSTTVWRQRQEIVHLTQERSGALDAGAAVTESLTPLPNLPLVFFPAVGTVRGSEKALRIPRTSEYFLLVFDVRRAYPSYRLEIGRPGTDVSILSSDALKKVGLSELSLAIPRPLISAGDYWLRLSGLGDEGVELLQKYSLSVEIES